MSDFVNKTRKGSILEDLCDPRLQDDASSEEKILSSDGVNLIWETNSVNVVTKIADNSATEIIVDRPVAGIRAGILSDMEHLETLHLGEVNGIIEKKALAGLETLSHFSMSPDSVITEVGEGAFLHLGVNRNSTDRFYLDFSNSTFLYGNLFSNSGKEGSYSPGGEVIVPDTPAVGLWNTEVRMPATLIDIQYGTTSPGSREDYTTFLAGSENCDVYFNGPVVPPIDTIAILPTDEQSHIYVKYEYFHAYRIATNWAELENLFAFVKLPEGAELPKWDAAGYAITWYADKACTEKITVSTGAEAYGVGSDLKIASVINVSSYQGTVKVYHGSDLLNPLVAQNGWTVRVVPEPTTENNLVLKVFEIDDVDYEGEAEIEISHDIDVAISYGTVDSPVIHPVFGKNSVVTLATIADTGELPSCWHIGDEIAGFMLLNVTPVYDAVIGEGKCGFILAKKVSENTAFRDASERAICFKDSLLFGALKRAFDTELSNVNGEDWRGYIAPVLIPDFNYNTGVCTTETNVFSLSCKELTGMQDYDPSTDIIPVLDFVSIDKMLPAKVLDETLVRISTSSQTTRWMDYDAPDYQRCQGNYTAFYPKCYHIAVCLSVVHRRTQATVTFDSSIAVEDSQGNSLTSGDVVPVGTRIHIVASPTSQSFLLNINGEKTCKDVMDEDVFEDVAITLEEDIALPSQVTFNSSLCKIEASTYDNTVYRLVLPRYYYVDGNYREVQHVAVSLFASAGGYELFGSVILPDNATELSYYTAQGYKLEIPASVTKIGASGDKAMISGGKLDGIVVETGNTVYDSRNNCNSLIRTSDNTIISMCPKSTIPDGVVALADLVLDGLEFPEDYVLRIPSSLTMFGVRNISVTLKVWHIVVDPANTVYDSRNNCNAIVETATNKLILAACSDFILDSTVVELGDGSMSRYVYGSLCDFDFSHITRVGDRALAYVRVNYADFRSVTVLDAKAFRSMRIAGHEQPETGYEIAVLELGVGLSSIGDQVFSDLFGLNNSNLIIRYEGTMDQWNSIQKGEDLFFGSAISKIVCSDGEIPVE